MARHRALFAVAAILVATPALADPSAQEKAMASQLFDDAEKAFADGNVADACPKYAESQRLDPQLGTLLHLGECYARADKSASAWASFKDALEIAVSRSDSREPRIRRRVAELEKTLSKLVIDVPDSAPADLEIRQDGNVVGRPIWGTPVPIDPGSHKVTASAAGMKPWTGSVEVASGASTAHLAIPALEPAPKAAEPAAAAATAAAVSSSPSEGGGSSGTTQRILGWTAMGLGAGGIAIGIVYNVIRSDKISQRDGLCQPNNLCNTTDEQNQVDNLTNEARTASTISLVGFISGGVLLAGGLALVLTAPHGGGTVSNVTAAPVLARDFQGVAVTGRLW